MKKLTIYHWIFATSFAFMCHVAMAYGWFNSMDPPRIQRSAGSPITVVGSLSTFADQQAVEETVEEIIEPIQEVSELEPIKDTPISDLQAEEIKPILEELVAEPIPQKKPPKKVKKKNKKKQKPIKKKNVKKDKKKKKKRLAGKRLAALKKGGGARGRQKKIAGRAEISNYRGRVQSHLARYKRSPGGGKRGRTTVSFTLSRSGGVSRIRLVRGSGNSAIDRATLAMVRRASPFPVMPAGGPRRMRFTVPVMYR